MERERENKNKNIEVLESYFKYCNYLSVASDSITFLFSLRLWGIETLHHIIRRVKIEKKNLFFLFFYNYFLDVYNFIAFFC